MQRNLVHSFDKGSKRGVGVVASDGPLSSIGRTEPSQPNFNLKLVLDQAQFDGLLHEINLGRTQPIGLDHGCSSGVDIHNKNIEIPDLSHLEVQLVKDKGIVVGTSERIS